MIRPIALVLLALLPSACVGGAPTPWKVAETACDVVHVAALACGMLPEAETSGGAE